MIILCKKIHTLAKKAVSLHPIMSDKELLTRIKDSGSEGALRELFERHYDRLYRVALYFTQQEEWAKEVTLDVFAHLWERRQTMVIPEDFRHYSFVMVKNGAFSMLRHEDPSNSPRGGGTGSLSSYEEAQDAAAEESAPDPQLLMEESELFEEYERLLGELPDRCREVFVRVKEEGMSYAEVAAEMGISTKTVDAQLQKALQYLRSNLAKYLGRDHGKRFFAVFL